MSKLLPSDWEIWVKEHPRQNPLEFPNIRRLNYRHIEDYYKLMKLKNVKFLSLEFPTEKALELSKMTASCTGSILWEGLINNKNVIRFGSTWHDSCKSCFHIEEFLNDKLLFKRINQINENEIKKNVDQFITDLSKYAIYSSNSDFFSKKSKVDERILIKNLVDFILQYLINYKKNSNL